MNRVFLLLLASSRIASSLVDALVRLCVRGAGECSLFPDCPPSLPTLRERRGGPADLVRVVPRYYAGIRLLVASDAGLMAFAFPSAPKGCSASGDDEISQFLCEGFPRMLRVSDRAEPLLGSRYAPPKVLPSAQDNSVGAPDFRFRGSMAGLRFPLSTLRRRPRQCLRDTRGQGGSLLLPASNFHRLSFASFTGALSLRQRPPVREEVNGDSAR